MRATEFLKETSYSHSLYVFIKSFLLRNRATGKSAISLLQLKKALQKANYEIDDSLLKQILMSFVFVDEVSNNKIIFVSINSVNGDNEKQENREVVQRLAQRGLE